MPAAQTTWRYRKPHIATFLHFRSMLKTCTVTPYNTLTPKSKNLCAAIKHARRIVVGVDMNADRQFSVGVSAVADSQWIISVSVAKTWRTLPRRRASGALRVEH